MGPRLPNYVWNLGLALIVSRGRPGQQGEVNVTIYRPSKNAALRYQREESRHTDVVYSTVKRGAQTDRRNISGSASARTGTSPSPGC